MSEDPQSDPRLNMLHVLHCIDYIRQGIICHADLTLVDTSEDHSSIGSTARKCRDFSAVERWVRQYAWNMTDWET